MAQSVAELVEPTCLTVRPVGAVTSTGSVTAFRQDTVGELVEPTCTEPPRQIFHIFSQSPLTKLSPCAMVRAMNLNCGKRPSPTGFTGGAYRSLLTPPLRVASGRVTSPPPPPPLMRS
ncbi:MAG: hypothetical protein LBS86_01355 [Treponema sp.]|nr:hypothetical protein [Treponema sp.]